jgi:hypothetical protein
VLGAIFVLSCLALPQYIRAKNSAQWPTTKGVITISRLQVGYLKQMKGYYGNIQYKYHVGNIDYEGSQRSFNRVHLAVEDAWQRVIDAYPVGKAVDVYYDPKNPGFAVLEPGLLGEMDLLYRMVIFFIGCSALGFLILLSTNREHSLQRMRSCKGPASAET